MIEKDCIYEREIERQIRKMERILNLYASKSDEIDEIDELAIQRAFYVLIGAIIGISRYYLKVKHGVNVNRSREAFDELKNRGSLNKKDYEQIMKIIGFRNVLVHDYLELESAILLSLLKKRSYNFLIEFYEKLSKALH